jgi:adenylate cyclase
VESEIEFNFAGFTLDLRRGILHKAGRPVEIRPKAFHLLSCLVKNAGRVISKDELLESIWPGVTVTEDSLTQCIGEVRRVLEKGPASSAVKTIPRRGYMFEASAIQASGVGLAPDAVEIAANAGKPSIAVLPFRNLSSDSEQDYFADGIVDDITTALGHFRQIVVISRNSAFSYKGQAINGADVSRALGVRYLLQGSVRKAGDRLRITAQLTDALGGVQLWADHYDGDLPEVFAFQDEVTRMVIGAVAPRMALADLERLKRWRPENFGAYELFLKAQESLRQMTREGNENALAAIERALTLEPGYAAAAGVGAWACTMRAAQGWDTMALEHKSRGLDLAARALASGSDDSEALSYGGYTIGYLGAELETGVKAVERAIALNPNSALAFTNAGWLKTYLGDSTGAIRHYQNARTISPRDPGLYRLNTGLACALILQGEFAHAVEAAREAKESNPNYVAAHRALASALAQLGRLDDARNVIGDLLRIDPSATITGHANRSAIKISGKFEPVLRGLRLAGLPE